MRDNEKNGIDRRTFTKLGVGAAAALGAASLAGAQSPASELESRDLVSSVHAAAERSRPGC